jgi:SPP1 gp7 family putative phage head morphogenesis protein
MNQAAMLQMMERETAGLLSGAIARGARAMDAVTGDVLSAVRRADSFEAVAAVLRDPLAIVDTQTRGAILLALDAAMVTGDLLGRAQVTREAAAQGVQIAPIAHVFVGQGTGAGFAELGTLDVEPLPPLDAIAYFEGKVPLTRTAFDEISDIYRGRAFTIAGQQTVQAVQTVQDWLTKSLQDGSTFKDFLGGLTEAAEAGGIRAVNPYHAATVFTTNIQIAYNAGRFEMYNAPEVIDAFPYFQYHTVGDDRVRPTHAQMDGYIARRDDPVWNLWYPPNGFNCARAGTPILTGRGTLPIENVRHGDWVLTHQGRRRPVIELHVNRYVGELVRIQLSDGRQFDITPNHEFFTKAGWIPASALDGVEELPDFLDAWSRVSPRSPVAGEPAGLEIQHSDALPFDVLVSPEARPARGFENLYSNLLDREVKTDPVRLDQEIEEWAEAPCDRRVVECGGCGRHQPSGIGVQGRMFAVQRGVGLPVLLPDLNAPSACALLEDGRLPGDAGVCRLGLPGGPVPAGSVDLHDGAAHGERLGSPPFGIVNPLRGDGLAATATLNPIQPEQLRNGARVDAKLAANTMSAPEISKVLPSEPAIERLSKPRLASGDHACTLYLHGGTVAVLPSHVKIESLQRIQFEGRV